VTEAQTLLMVHLRELGLKPFSEVVVTQSRRFRFDVAVLAPHFWGFECNGHFKGKHGAGWSNDAEKINLAQAKGWKVFVFANKDVLSGKAKAWIQEHLL
jgi:hypothetical protein